MEKGRLAAFTDGVIAVIITIMVLELKVPHEASLSALLALGPTFFSYVLSFVYVAIYWTNHHHFFHLVQKVNGAVLWANIHLLFWLSLVPFASGWLGEHVGAALPTAVYGLSLLAPALAWWIMQTVIIGAQGPHSPMRRAIGRDLKGKLTPLVYVVGIVFAFIQPLVSDACYVGVALLWLTPDRRVERVLEQP